MSLLFMFFLVDIEQNPDDIVSFEYYSILNCFVEDDIKAKRFFESIIGNLNHLQQHGLVINGRLVEFSSSTVVADDLGAH